MEGKGDASVFNEDFISVQHDWQRSLESAKDQFFVNFKKRGQKTATIDVKCANGQFNVDDDSRIKASVDGNTLQLELDGRKKSFVAPYSVFESIHKTSINSVDLSPSENMIVSCDSNAELVVSDSQYGRRLRELQGHVCDIYRCRFFPSGMVVLSGGMDMTVRVFSVEDSWNARTMKGHKAAVHDIGVIGEGAEVVSCSRDGTLKVWNCGSAEITHDYHPEIGFLNCLALGDTDMTLVATGGESNKAAVYDFRTDEQVFSFDLEGPCSAIAFDSAMHLYTGTSAGSLYSFDLRTGAKAPTIVNTERGSVHRLTNNGVVGLIASFHDGTVAAYKRSLVDGQSYVEFTGADCDPVYDISVVGNTLLTACRDKTIRKYRLDTV